MYVQALRSGGQVTAKAKSRSVSGGGFESLLGEADASHTLARSSATTSPLGIDQVSALQSADPDQTSRQAAIEDSHALLDLLDGLKIELLAGRASPARLDQILALVNRQKSQTDPVLADIVAEIELRAAVEMAKLGRY